MEEVITSADLGGNRARFERMKRALALDHAAGRINDRANLAQVTVLREATMKLSS